MQQKKLNLIYVAKFNIVIGKDYILLGPDKQD